MTSLGVYYSYAKIPHRRYMEHGLEYITFYVPKNIVPRTICSYPPLVRDKPLGATEFVRLVYYVHVKRRLV